VAEAIIAELNIEQVYPKNIITEVTTYGEFYKAEDYHQNYFENSDVPRNGHTTNRYLGIFLS